MVRVVCALVVVLLVGACGGDDDAESVTGGRTTTTTTSEAAAGCDVDGAVDAAPVASIEATLTEYAVALSQPSAPAGAVELVATNVGLVDHELTVVRFDGDPGALPLNVVGGAELSELPEEAEVGRIWSFPPDATCEATFDLAPGRYALICNVVDDGTNPHYSQGMHAAFTVDPPSG
jgi:hypothetical protein